jgi:hypothetical protein
MKKTSIYGLNIAILCATLLSLLLGAGFHRVNMNRKYWALVNAGCINTNALPTLEKNTGQSSIADEHMTAVPKWMTDINSTFRLGMVATLSQGG